MSINYALQQKKISWRLKIQTNYLVSLFIYRVRCINCCHFIFLNPYMHPVRFCFCPLNNINKVSWVLSVRKTALEIWGEHAVLLGIRTKNSNTNISESIWGQSRGYQKKSWMIYPVNTMVFRVITSGGNVIPPSSHRASDKIWRLESSGLRR